MSVEQSFRCIGVGEILWDLLPTGKQVGGAPANFAYHARALGMDASVITRLGRDDLGRELLAHFEKLDLPMASVQLDDVAPTGTVSVGLSGDGVPHFTIHENVAWDRITAVASSEQACRAADVICFGTLAQRCEPSRTTIRRLLRSAESAALRIFDINLRQQFFSRDTIEESLRLANVLKLNETELPVLANIFELNHSIESQIETLADRFDLELVAFTRGLNGSLLYSNGRWSNQSGIPTEIKDTVGAGDSFTAAMTVGWLRGFDLDEINALANEVASYVCSCAGATPRLPENLRAKFLKPSSAAKAAARA